jgi:hypothetical protein
LKAKFEKEGAAQSKSFVHVKAEPPKAKKETPSDGKGKINSQPIYNCDIKCFRCLGSGHIASQLLNKRKMIVKHGEIESESDKSNIDEMPLLEDCSDVEIVYSVEGEALVITYVLNAQVKEDDVDQ